MAHDKVDASSDEVLLKGLVPDRCECFYLDRWVRLFKIDQQMASDYRSC